MKTRIMICVVWAIALLGMGWHLYEDGSWGWGAAMIWASVACYLALKKAQQLDRFIREIKDFKNSLRP